jgi:hypothetical protein
MLDETLHEVKVIIYVDGVEYDSHDEQVPAYAIPYIASAAIVQIQEPDLERAMEEATEEG